LAIRSDLVRKSEVACFATMIKFVCFYFYTIIHVWRWSYGDEYSIVFVKFNHKRNKLSRVARMFPGIPLQLGFWGWETWWALMGRKIFYSRWRFWVQLPSIFSNFFFIIYFSWKLAVSTFDQKFYSCQLFIFRGKFPFLSKIYITKILIYGQNVNLTVPIISGNYYIYLIFWGKCFLLKVALFALRRLKFSLDFSVSLGFLISHRVPNKNQWIEQLLF